MPRAAVISTRPPRTLAEHRRRLAAIDAWASDLGIALTPEQRALRARLDAAPGHRQAPEAKPQPQSSYDDPAILRRIRKAIR